MTQSAAPAERVAIEAPFTLPAQIEARASHPAFSNNPLLRQAERTWTYRRFRDECVRVGHWILARRAVESDEAPRVAMLLENHIELLALYGGCGYAGATLFGVNTGLQGATLAGVLNQSGADLLVVDERFVSRLGPIASDLDRLGPDRIFVLRTTGSEDISRDQDWLAALGRDIGPVDSTRTPPDVEVTPETNLMVIYTSGTTGLPKGINNNHLKLMAIGHVVAGNLALGPDDCGYACMPLFHSNALFLGFQPCFVAGGTLAIRERFSATGFVPDIQRYGVTYWNYVGEPVHYVLDALEKEFDGDADRIRAAVAAAPENRLRYAIGNGAAPPDIDRFIDWLGLDDMMELYGSTEAAISTFRRLGDPRGSVGQINDDAVKILDASGEECPPAEVDADGKILNYAEAVGEICRVAPDTSLFQGYFDNADANASKYREGVYHSGDLGHVLLRDEARFLFFDGRTDDWIRKDGENFSAAQVARLIQEHADIDLVAAYGVPCAVSDEHVMVAVQMHPGAVFDPQAFFEWCEAQIEGGALDRKWMPDYVRIVEEFSYTETQKILVRELKAVHFDRRRLPDEPLYWRKRASTRFESFSKSDFETLRAEFERAEREELVDR